MTPTEHYPDGTVRTLLETDHVTKATRQALTDRINLPERQPQFFSADEFALLQAICNRLIPQQDRPVCIDLAGGIDERLTQNESNGWRYDTMPPDRDAYRLGLKGVAETAMVLFQQPFRQLSPDQQDSVLTYIQTAQSTSASWEGLPAERFFEELLAEAVENYYSHPLAQEEIGCVAMADVPGWQRIGLNQLDEREPRPLFAGPSSPTT
ncbi:gluconate 2-dehydrogenase subunit 3 family protein [Spirosoma fluminis]